MNSFKRLARKCSIIGLFVITVFLIMYPNPLTGEKGWQLSYSIVSLMIGILWILPKKGEGIISVSFLFLTSIYFSLQTIYYRAFQLYGLSSTLWSFRSEVTAFTSSVVEFFQWIDLKYLLLPGLFIIIRVYINRISNQNIFRDVKRMNRLLGLLFISISFLLWWTFGMSISITKSDDPIINRKSDYMIYQSASNPVIFVERFGLIGLAYRDAASYMLNPFPSMASYEEEITQILLSKEKPEPNEYTGIFKGKSLILIEAESLNNFAIDPVLTPTLFMLKTQGLFIDGYNSPLLTGSTSDTEFMANTSLLPAFDGKIVFNDYADNVFPQTLASVLTQNGYYSIAVHNNYGMYYNRTNMLPHLGYTFYDATGLGMYDNVDDSRVMDYLKWMIYGINPSFSFWVTFNAHQPYEENTLTDTMKSYLPKITQRYPNMPLAEQVYMAKNMDLDLGLSKLLLDYKENGILDDTVIAIYGDHYPKGLFEEPTLYESSCEEKGLNSETCFRTPFIIYNSFVQGKIISKASSTLDISPTLYDLFGVDYDPRYTLGHSVFDSNYGGFNFNPWDIIRTDNYIYDPLQDTLQAIVEGDNDAYLKEAHQLYYEYDVLKNLVPLNYFDTQTYKDKFQLEQ